MAWVDRFPSARRNPGFEVSVKPGLAHAERRAAERKQMQEAVAALRTTEGWRRWLRARRHFHRYSFANQLLIAEQCPEATCVASFGAWLKLGYAVQRGQHAIRIWRPCEPSKKAIERWRSDGADPEKEPRTFFLLAPVFDASQLAPRPDFPASRSLWGRRTR